MSAIADPNSLPSSVSTRPARCRFGAEAEMKPAVHDESGAGI